MPESANSVHIGDLSAGVEFVIDEAALKRKLDQAERGLTKKIQIPVEAQVGGATAGLKDMEAQLGKLKTATRSAAQEQIEADKARTASARAAAAEAAASAAKIREQQAQLALTAKMAAQSEREAQATVREASRQASEARKQAVADARAQAQAARESAQAQRDANRLATQAERDAARARKEAIDTQVLAYANLRKELNLNRISEAEFNQGGDAIIATLQQMAQQAGYTAKELTRVTNLEDRIGREQNTLAGVVNPLSFSGNVVVGLQSALPGIMQGLQQVTAMSPSLGAAAGQLGNLVGHFGNAAKAAAPLASGATAAGTAMNTAGTAAGFLGTGVSGAAAAGLAAGTIFTALAAAVAAFGIAANKAADEGGKLEFTVAKVSTLTDKLPGQLGNTGTTLLNFSRDLGVSYEKLGEGLQDVLGAGVRGTEDMGAALQMTYDAAKLAEAGLTDTNVATDVLTSTMNAYKMQASQTKEVSDALFQAVLDGKMSFNDLAGSLGNVTAISASSGVALQEVLAAMATLTANGIKASTSVDYLRGLITSIVNPSKEAQKNFDALGIAYGDSALKAKGLTGVLQEIIQKTGGSTTEMSKLLNGVEAVTAATSLASGNFDRLRTNLDNQTKSAGATETAYQKLAGTLKKENDKLDANWKSLWANLGNYFLPFKTDVISFLNDALEKLNLFIQKTNAARNATQSQEDLDRLRAQLKNAESGPLGKQEILKHLARAKESGVQSVIDNWTRKLAQVDNEIIVLRGKIKESETIAAQAKADQIAANGPFAGPNMATGNVLMDLGVRGRTISQQFGLTAYSQAMKGKPGYEDGTHKGLDIKTAIGTQLFTPNDVRILAAKTGWNDGFGTFVKMVDAAGNTILTAHMSKLSEEAVKAVKTGATLKKGTLIGLSGNTGQSSGPHVHLETRDSRGRAFNPLTYGTTDAPTSTSTPSSSPTTDEKEGPVTAAMLARARELHALMEKAQKEAKAKPGDNTLALAYSKAKSDLEGWTEANKAHAKALEIVRETQEKTTSSTKDYVATQQDIAKYGNKALELYKALEKAQKGGNSQEIAAANTALNTWLGNSKVKKAVLEDEKKAYEARQAAAKKDAADAETAAKNRLKTQQDLQAALSRGQEQTAQNLLTSLKAQQAKELDLARDSAAKRAQITAQSGPAIIAAEDKLAAIRRDRAVKAAQQAAGEAKKLPGADLKAIEATRVEAVRQAYLTEKTERDKARADQKNAETQANRTALQAQQQHEKERLRLLAQAAQEARQLRYQEADATLSRIRDNNRAELDAFKGSAAEKLDLIRRQSQVEFDAAAAVARVKRDNALRVSANEGGPNRGERDQQIQQAYTDTINALKNTRVAAIRAAQNDLNRAMQEVVDSQTSKGFRDAYSQGYIPGANGFQNQGSGDTTALYKLAEERDTLTAIQEAFAGLGDSAAESARVIDRDLIPKIQAIIDKTDDPQLKKAAQDYLKFLRDSKGELDDLASQQATAWEKTVSEALNLADAYGDLGDTETQLSTLQSTLIDLYAAMDDGENVAAQIDKVTKAIEDLIAATTLNDQFGEFVATLGGGLEDQIAQVVEKLAATTDVKLKTRLTALLADLRGQLPQWDNSVYGNLIPDGNGGGFTKQGRGNTAALQFATENDLIRSFSGPEGYLQVLDDGEKFGQAFFDKFTEQGRDLFLGKLGEISVEDFAALGEDALTALIEKIGDDERWADLKVKLEGSLARAVEIRQEIDALVQDATQNPQDYRDGAPGGSDAPAPGSAYDRNMALLFKLDSQGDLADPVRVNALKVAFAKLREEAEITDAELQALLDTVDELAGGGGTVMDVKPLSLQEWQQQVSDLTAQFDAGEITAEEYAAGLNQMGVELEDYAQKAEKAGNPALAKAFREMVTQLRALNPETAALIKKFDKLQQYGEWANQVLGALGNLTSAMAEGEQQYDKTGKAMNTPWTDLSANIQGAQKGIQLAMSMAQDVAKIAASGGADVGAWISLATKVISAIADALSGFKRAYAEAQRMRDDFAASNPLLNPDDFQKVSVQSRGWLADIFMGPKIVNEIDKVGVHFASSFAEHVASGFSAGLKKAIMEGDTSQIKKNLYQDTYEGIVDGMIESFKTEVIKEIMAPFLKAWADAMKTPGTEDDMAALDMLDRTVLPQLTQAGEAWANNVIPRLQQIRQQWNIDTDGKTAPDLLGNAPTAQLGIPRIEVTLPTETFKPLTDFAATIPRWEAITTKLETALTSRLDVSPGALELKLTDVALKPLSDFAASVPVFDLASRRLLDAANIIVAAHAGDGMPPRTTGNGGMA